MGPDASEEWELIVGVGPRLILLVPSGVDKATFVAPSRQQIPKG